jgi:isoquinoline 1-oxidoreductase beta subunit
MNQVSRRSFIKNSGGAGIALWLGISTWHDAGKASSIYEAKNFTPYIIVDSSGSITIFNTKPEMGQGTFQSIPALIAEEFEVSFDQIIIKQSNGEPAFGPNQRAGGSASIRTSYSDLRKIGASAREVFIEAASLQWKVDAGSCYAENGKVFHKPTNRSLTYGELVVKASKLDLSKEPKLKDPKDFKILGKMASRPDVPLKTCGKAEFGIDVRLPGMLYASVERCPVIGGTLKSFDATEALKIAGVKKIGSVERVIGKYHSVGVAVIANSYWTALNARKKLKIEWDTASFETFNTSAYEDSLRTLVNQEGLLDKNIGSIDTLNLKPQNTIEAFYETPMQAHHTLETLNCVAQVRGNKVEIWTSTQVPSSVTGTGETDLHKYIGIPPENIQLHNKFIGGGFGRRLYIDFIVEAVNIAKLTDKPVKLIWSREDATEQGPFRPMTFSQLKGGFSDDGKLLAFQHKVISPSLQEARDGIFDKTKVDSAMVEGIGVQAYEFPNLKTSYVRADFHVPVASWRSVTSSTVAFPPECFLDELAYKANKDPMEFRLELLSNPSDTKRVLLKLKEMSHWDEPLPKGKGRGVAQWEFFAGLGGQVVEVTYRPEDKSIKIDKVYAVIDLGEVVNPDNVINQVQGSIVMALGAATKPGITFKDGKVEQHNFYDNPLVRMNEVPEIEVQILAEGGKVKGVGEPGLPPFAPALANAIFAATGKRIRKMPFDINNI